LEELDFGGCTGAFFFAALLSLVKRVEPPAKQMHFAAANARVVAAAVYKAHQEADVSAHALEQAGNPVEGTPANGRGTCLGNCVCLLLPTVVLQAFCFAMAFCNTVTTDLILDGIYHAQLVELLELELSNAQPLLDDPCATLQANFWGHYALL
jgi:hypothetical protein